MLSYISNVIVACMHFHACFAVFVFLFVCCMICVRCVSCIDVLVTIHCGILDLVKA